MGASYLGRAYLGKAYLGKAYLDKAGMSPNIYRREFLRSAGLAAAIASASLAQPSHAQSKRRLKIGHTGITWGFKPEDAAVAIPDVASLGYQGYESFGNVLEAWQPKGGLRKVLDENRHLRSSPRIATSILPTQQSARMKLLKPSSGPTSLSKRVESPRSSGPTE